MKTYTKPQTSQYDIRVSSMLANSPVGLKNEQTEEDEYARKSSGNMGGKLWDDMK